MTNLSLEKTYSTLFSSISESTNHYVFDFKIRETGIVSRVSEGVVFVKGLPHVGLEELVSFSSNNEIISGMVFSIEPSECGVILFGETSKIHAGMEVKRSGKVVTVPVGKELLGRIIDPLGRPLDLLGPIKSTKQLPIERPAPPIYKRSPVKVPLQTGLKVIDALIPIGRGQRELILGDRQTGKTTIALDTILNQKGKNVICIYNAIGQHASSVAQVVATLKEGGAMDYTVLVVSEGNQAPGLHFISPYAATSIAESFMEEGRDVLIVYDDLINHARAYRELSLLLRRPPGREAFPGDIFYIHSRLLERSTHLKEEFGGGSLTALPLVETEAQNIAAYIPTNLISITDGQIYLSPTLFSLGILPAIDVGKSVSRVGGKAQLPSYRSITGHLKLAYSQFEELENFARFGTRLDTHTQKVIEHGQRIRFCLKQGIHCPYSALEQVIILLCLNNKLFSDIPLDKMQGAENKIKELAAKLPADLLNRFHQGEIMSEEDQSLIITQAKDILKNE